MNVKDTKCVKDRTQEEHLSLIKNKHNGSVRDYLLSMGEFKDDAEDTESVIDKVMNEPMKHCENPVNFFAYYYLDKTEDRLEKKDLDYDLRLLLKKLLDKCTKQDDSEGVKDGR